MADKKDDTAQLSASARREVLRKLGRFTAVSVPAVTLLLAAQSKPALAVTSQTMNCLTLRQPNNTTPAWSEDTNAKA